MFEVKCMMLMRHLAGRELQGETQVYCHLLPPQREAGPGGQGRSGEALGLDSPLALFRKIWKIVTCLT